MKNLIRLIKKNAVCLCVLLSLVFLTHLIQFRGLTVISVDVVTHTELYATEISLGGIIELYTIENNNTIYLTVYEIVRKLATAAFVVYAGGLLWFWWKNEE